MKKKTKGGQMLNNSMTVTEKFKNAFVEEKDMNTPRAKRVAKLSIENKISFESEEIRNA